MIGICFHERCGFLLSKKLGEKNYVYFSFRTGKWESDATNCWKKNLASLLRQFSAVTGEKFCRKRLTITMSFVDE